jgi:hypothetical protein
MAQFIAFDNKVEVNGETVLSIVDGMGALRKKAYEILEKNNIKDPKAGNWYSQQSWLNSFKEISNLMGVKTLRLIGQKIPENANFPKEINSFEIALGAIDVAYHMNHRNGEIGTYKYLGITDGKKEAEIICENPYPCEFDQGIIESMAKRFKPKDSLSVSIKHAEGKCRSNGEQSCKYILFWI